MHTMMGIYHSILGSFLSCRKAAICLDSLALEVHLEILVSKGDSKALDVEGWLEALALEGRKAVQETLVLKGGLEVRSEVLASKGRKVVWKP